MYRVSFYEVYARTMIMIFLPPSKTILYSGVDPSRYSISPPFAGSFSTALVQVPDFLVLPHLTTRDTLGRGCCTGLLVLYCTTNLWYCRYDETSFIRGDTLLISVAGCVQRTEQPRATAFVHQRTNYPSYQVPAGSEQYIVFCCGQHYQVAHSTHGRSRKNLDWSILCIGASRRQHMWEQLVLWIHRRRFTKPNKLVAIDLSAAKYCGY